MNNILDNSLKVPVDSKQIQPNISFPSKNEVQKNIQENSSRPRTTFIILIAIFVMVGAYLFVSQKSNVIEQPPKTIVATSPSPQIAQPTQKNGKIAMIKDAQVVIKDTETGDEVKTGIPIAWEGKDATWCQGFDWSADGKKIVAFGIHKLFDTETNKLIELPTIDGSLLQSQWNPKGNSIFYSVGNKEGTWLSNLSDSTTIKISDYTLFSENYNHPVSPNGNKAIFVKKSGQKDEYGNLENKYIIVDLATKLETEISMPDDVQPLSNLTDINWAPTSDEVAFVYDVNIPDKYNVHRTIATFNVTTNQVIKFNIPSISNRDPVYSPDGKYIIFQNENAQEVWKINRDGTEPIKIGDSPIDAYMRPNFSADSKKVVYTKFGEGVKVVSITGEDPELVESSAECAIWSP